MPACGYNEAVVGSLEKQCSPKASPLLFGLSHAFRLWCLMSAPYACRNVTMTLLFLWDIFTHWAPRWMISRGICNKVSQCCRLRTYMHGGQFQREPELRRMPVSDESTADLVHNDGGRW